MEQRATALAAVVNDLWSLHQPFLGAESSLPSWLGDQLVNSLSHIRTAMWFQNCSHCHRSKDARLDGAGFWRQWESYACDDLDSIHNDGERHIPYLMFFPNNKLNASICRQVQSTYVFPLESLYSIVLINDRFLRM